MGLTKVEQAEALTHLLKEDYDGYGRLVEESRAISRESKIDLLYKGLVLAGRRVRLAESDESVLHAREDLAQAITGGAEVLPFRAPKEEQA